MANFGKNNYISAQHSVKHLQSRCTLYTVHYRVYCRAMIKLLFTLFVIKISVRLIVRLKDSKSKFV